MNARNYEVTMTGAAPLLLHHDNLAHAEVMKRWEKSPANSKESVKGDDRSPAWRWLGCLYVEGGHLVIPSDNLMTVLREGGKRCPTGRGTGTYKSQTQSGIVCNEIGWPIDVGRPGKEVRTIHREELDGLNAETDFAKHEALVDSIGFSLFVKRAKVGASKHVRVRPRFDRWSITGTLLVTDETITTDVLQNILTFAGKYAGLGDWRPSSPKSPGSFGTFTATLREL